MNKNFWKLYKESEEGKRIIGLFDKTSETYEDTWLELMEYFQSLGYSNSEASLYFEYWKQFLINQEKTPYLPESMTFETFVDLFDNVRMIGYEQDRDDWVEDFVIWDTDKNSYRKKMSEMTFFSIFLYENYDIFFPIVFPRRFDIIQRNCGAIGLELPEIPRSKDYKEYIYYYWDLCQAILKFQDDNELTSAEMCACLYDFAPKCIDDVCENDSLPLPTNVWLTGAGVDNGDYEALDEMAKASSCDKDSVWTCNERTRKGDIIIFYSTAPYSGIHFIGRAKTGGVVSPFDYYKHSTTVCDVLKLDVPISLKALKSDPYLKDVTIVRQGMRGVNGKEFSARDYQELLRLEKQLGGSIDKLPKLFETETMDFGKIKVERDVEENILIPFLKKIGYSETDWTRQLSLKAGRQEKAIPDFVFFAKGEAHFEKAPFVIEAKLDMSSCTERQNAFEQCFSYARMLSSKVMAICDKERIVVYRLNKNGVALYTNPIFERHWASVYSDENFGSELRKLIGRDVVAEM